MHYLYIYFTFVYWVNNAYLFEISRFHYKERTYMCMYVCVCIYVCIYVYMCIPIRSDPIRFSDPIPNNCSAYSPAKKRPRKKYGVSWGVL